jgi:hypothetical protein
MTRSRTVYGAGPIPGWVHGAGAAGKGPEAVSQRTPPGGARVGGGCYEAVATDVAALRTRRT